MSLTPAPVARLLGSLIFFQGAVLIFFWKVLDFAIATGLARYANTTGRLARSFFRSDRELITLLENGHAWLPWLLGVGMLVMFTGIIVMAFPRQTAQILVAFGILRTSVHPVER